MRDYSQVSIYMSIKYPISLYGSELEELRAGDKTPANLDGYVRRDNVAGFTRINTSSFSVTNNATNNAIFQPGLPLAYRKVANEGPFTYGIIKSYTTGTIVIMGIPLPDPLGELCVGPCLWVNYEICFVAGTLTVGDDKLNTVGNTVLNIARNKQYLVAVRGQVKTAATNADLRVAVGINAASTDLFDNPIYLNLARSTNVVDSGVNISLYNYLVNFLDKMFINIDQVGSSVAGANLTVMLIFVTPGEPAISKIYGFGGGGYTPSYSNVIDYINTNTVTQNATDRGDTTVARTGINGITSINIGFFCGGNNDSGYLDNIDYIDMWLLVGNAISTGTLSLDKGFSAGIQGSIYGFSAGGTDGSNPLNVIDYLILANSVGNALDRYDLTVARYYTAGVSGLPYGFAGCGHSDSNVIDYINNTVLVGNAIDRGDASVGRTSPAGLSGVVYGCWGGGKTGIAIYSNVIDYIDHSLTTGNSLDRLDLTVARMSPTGVSGFKYGFFEGGAGSGGYSNVIDYINMALTTGNAVDTGDTTVARSGMGGV